MKLTSPVRTSKKNCINHSSIQFVEEIVGVLVSLTNEEIKELVTNVRDPYLGITSLGTRTLTRTAFDNHLATITSSLSLLSYDLLRVKLTLR